jgi:hypothetical protein
MDRFRQILLLVSLIATSLTEVTAERPQPPRRRRRTDPKDQSVSLKPEGDQHGDIKA